MRRLGDPSPSAPNQPVSDRPQRGIEAQAVAPGFGENLLGQSVGGGTNQLLADRVDERPVLPIQIGAKDVAFPRLNLASWYIFMAGAALAILRDATDGFVPPEWACNTYRAMLDSLARLESDMHQHIHKENNVLFPKALQLESATTPSAGL